MAYSKQRRNISNFLVQTDEGVNVDLRHDAICQAACRKSFNARASNHGFQVQDFSDSGVRFVTQTHRRNSKFPHTPVRLWALEALEKQRQKPRRSTAYHLCFTEDCNTPLCSTPCDTIPCQVLHTVPCMLHSPVLQSWRNSKLRGYHLWSSANISIAMNLANTTPPMSRNSLFISNSSPASRRNPRPSFHELR